MSSLHHTIAVALDGSTQAEAALPHAMALASRLGARLHLVRAVYERTLPGQEGAGRREEACHVARCYLDGVAARARALFPLLRISAAAPAGLPAQAILDEVTLVHADLLVLATYGAGCFAPCGLGPVAAEVTRAAALPVLLIRPPVSPVSSNGAEEGCAPGGSGGGGAEHATRSTVWLRQRVRALVPLSGAPSAEGALPYVVHLGTFLPLAATLLHVLPPPGGPAGRGLDPCASPDCLIDPAARLRGSAGTPHVRPLNWATAAAYGHRAAGWVDAHGVPCRIQIRCGEVVGEICRGGQEGADLVVMGVCARAVTRWNCSPVVDGVLRTCRQPVLLVPSRRTEAIVPPGAATSGFSPMAGDQFSDSLESRVTHALR